jgi:hypothetical protein
MAEIDDLISKDALANLEKLELTLNKIVVSLDKVVASSAALDSALSKASTATKDSATATKDMTSATTEATKITKDLKLAEDETVKAKIKFAKATKEQREELTSAITLEDKEAGTLDKLAARNKQLTAERRKLNLETKEGQKRLREINGELDKNNKFIKGNNDALGRQKINIGNYSSALGGLPGPIGMAASAMSSFFTIIVANPVGAVLLAIVGTVMLLVKAFKRTEEGGDKIGRVFKQIGATVTVLIDRLSGVATTLFKIFTGEAKLKDLKGAFAGVGDEIKRETELAGKLFDMMDKLEELEADNIVTNSIRRNQIAKLREEAAALNDTDVRKLQLLKEASRLIKEEATAEQELQKVRIAEKLNTADMAVSERVLSEAQKGHLLTLQELQDISQKNTTVEDLAAVNTEIAKYIDLSSSASMENRRLASTIGNIEEKVAAQLAFEKEWNQSVKNRISVEGEAASASLGYIDSKTATTLSSNEAIIESNQQMHDALIEQMELEAEMTKQANDLKVELVNSAFDLTSALYDRQFSKLEEQKAKELALAGADEKKKEAIEDKFAKKKGEIAKKQARAEKAQGLFNIAISTAQAIMKAYAQFGPIAGTILLPLILGIAALQTAAILSKPLPQYAKGTNYASGGPSIIGEKGSELVIDPSGKMSLSGNSAELVNLKRGSKIIPSDETKRIMSAAGKSQKDTIEMTIEKGNKEIVKAINEKEYIILGTSVGAPITKRKGNTYKSYFERHLS